ncbi:tail fiber domain-containing protein [Dyadobacter arcticus]|uniref:Peptidase S74 domain-containing protein n=1 Tax=Dyadobacter arcticus TaxID=1078754 RepID=A0ABX0UL74_9BACT|nr:tail fiber domain-containing protein [Dyadobacter arcticus]NIJ53763.1 hypothetical protein [Dyadobacter arcticus]
MRSSIFAAFFVFAAFLSSAQAPQQFSFQGVARDAEGRAISNATIGLRLTIHSTTTIGPMVYQETHNASTSQGGVFTVAVGAGTTQNGIFKNIDWKSEFHYLQVELDPGGGTNYVNLGSSQLLSVPYALHASEAGRWKNMDPIIQTGVIDEGGVLPAQSFSTYTGPKLIWYPRKAILRAGYIDNNNWDIGKIGFSSAAFGQNTLASGVASFATGVESEAIGNSAVAMGEKVISKASYSMSIGSYNDTEDQPSLSNLQSTDRVFQIGIGTFGARSNALTMLRNGNLGLGKSVLVPQFVLDVGGRIRIRRNNESAGLWLNNSQQEAKTFIGMKVDNEVGFYLGDDWKFLVNATGEGRLNGSLIQTSDRRLKKDFSTLSNSLSKVNQIQGYHFIWKDPKMDQSIQTGFIAQEVETIFPELVKTDEKGFKSVNYIGFIPHLIESVKDLKKENDELRKSVSQLSALEARVNTLTEMLQTLAAKQEATSMQTK